MGICTADSIINLALCCLGYIPGLLHAWYIIMKYPEPDYDSLVYEPIPQSAGQGGDVEGGRVYYYVSHEPIQHPSQRGYGTVQQPPEQNRSPAPKQQQQYQPQPEQGSGEGSSQGQNDSRPPPTYAEAVRGDNKVQSDE